MKIKQFIVLYVSDKEWIVSRGYKLYRYYPETDKLEYFSEVMDRKNAILSRYKLLRRFFRAEITHLYRFNNDNWMCIGKKALFKFNHKSGKFEKCAIIEKGSRPMNLCQAKDGTIYYGEYCYNPERKSMRIMQSKDNGSTWTVAYRFADGKINHIHGLFVDPYSDRVWVATGDDDCACIFGYTEDGFKNFVPLYEGSQKYRVCVPMFREHDIIYATDSQYEQNYIRSINRKTGETRNLQPIQGSGIYSAQIAQKMLVSTTVEPSAVNKDNSAHLWYSEDGEKWREIVAYKKDFWHTQAFQFGSIRFPNYATDSQKLLFHGRSLKCLDGKTVIMDINEIK